MYLLHTVLIYYYRSLMELFNMYYGFVKCICGGSRKVYNDAMGYREICKKCKYDRKLEVPDIYVYLIRGICKELY